MAEKIKILKVKVAYGGGLYNCDGIEWQGKLWLVPHWLDSADGKSTTPARLIRFDHLEHSDVRGTNLGDYVVSSSMPKELFALAPLQGPIAGHEYVELPALTLPEGEKPH